MRSNYLVSVVNLKMSDSGEAETPEQEFKSQEGGTTVTSNKRTLDEYLINKSFGTVKNVAKTAARKLDFERTEEDEDLGNQISGLKSLKRSAKPTARKLEFKATEDDDDALPLACSICRQPFLDPVVTNCNHYFCNLCALEHHETNHTCFVCNQPTLGIFNTAVEIKKKISKVREKAKAMVKEVLTIVEKAAVISKNADAMTAESTEIVEEIGTMVGIVEAHGEDLAADPSSWDSVIKLVENVEATAAKAREMAEKAAEMVKEANAMTETARAEMAKAFLVMKNVKWNV